MEKSRRRGLTYLIRRDRQDGKSIEIHLRDALSELTLIGRHSKLWTERVESPEDIDLITLTDEQLDRLASGKRL